MSDPRHSERLLSDVLGEGTSADFREGLLSQTLRLAHRRRRFRQARRATSALAVVAGLGLLVWHQLPSGRRPIGLPARPYALVRTQPLPREAWVETKPFPASSIFASLRTDNIVLTAEAAVRCVRLAMTSFWPGAATCCLGPVRPAFCGTRPREPGWHRRIYCETELARCPNYLGASPRDKSGRGLSQCKTFGSSRPVGCNASS